MSWVMDYLARARSVIEIETDSLQRMSQRLDGNFIEAVKILHHTLDHRGKVVVVGIAATLTVVVPIPAAVPRPEIVQEPAKLGVQAMDP